jgi:hypothetical protein
MKWSLHADLTVEQRWNEAISTRAARNVDAV